VVQYICFPFHVFSFTNTAPEKQLPSKKDVSKPGSVNSVTTSSDDADYKVASAE